MKVAAIQVSTVKDVNVWTSATYVVQYIAGIIWMVWPLLEPQQQSDILALLGGDTIGRYVAIALHIGTTMAARKLKFEWNPPWTHTKQFTDVDSEGNPS